MQRLQQTVIASIAKAASLDPKAIAPQSTFEELGIDSLDVITIVFELEKAFETEIPEELELSDLKDVGAVISMMEVHLKTGLATHA